MLTPEECKQWLETAGRVPRPVVEAWMSELYSGCKLEEVRWDDDGCSPYLFFVVDTLCCHLDYSDPPAWFVFRVLTNYKKEIDHERTSL